MKEKLILVGGGGHCRAVIDVVRAQGVYEVAGIVDVAEKVGTHVFDYPIIGTDADLHRLTKEFGFFFITVGHVTQSKKRRNLFGLLTGFGATFPVLKGPTAYVSNTAHIGAGSIVMHRAVVNVNAHIGENCILNTASVVEHDSSIGDHNHLGPTAVVNGGCKIGSDCLIGSNAVILPGKNIGRNSIVAAGSVIISDIDENLVVAGNPGKFKKANG